MEINPYQSPEMATQANNKLAVDPRTENARQLLSPVSLGILVGGLIHAVPFLAMIPAVILSAMLDVQNSGRPMSVNVWFYFSIKLLAMICVITLSAGAVFGAWQMHRIRSRPWAVFACILAMIPNAIICVTLPLAIWGLYLLNRPDIRAAFERERLRAGR